LSDKRIRVLICDDHAIMRGGLRRILVEDDSVEVIGEAASSAEVIAAVGADPPDVLIMDVSLPDRDGISTIKDVLRDHPEIRVLILTMHDEPAYVREAFAVGAMGYLVKTEVDSELVRGVHEVAAGRPHFEHRLGAAALMGKHEQKPNQPSHPLSEREVTVLRMLAMGYTNSEIAQELVLSVRTVETYRARIQQKTGVRGRAAMVRIARKWGILNEVI